MKKKILLMILVVLLICGVAGYLLFLRANTEMCQFGGVPDKNGCCQDAGEVYDAEAKLCCLEVIENEDGSLTQDCFIPISKRDF
jgi:flagellar basal body-associated protein FliL